MGFALFHAVDGTMLLDDEEFNRHIDFGLFYRTYKITTSGEETALEFIEEQMSLHKCESLAEEGFYEPTETSESVVAGLLELGLYCPDDLDKYKLFGAVNTDQVGAIYLEFRACNATKREDQSSCETDETIVNSYMEIAKPNFYMIYNSRSYQNDQFGDSVIS